MGPTWLCVLGLFLLKTLQCGHAQDIPKAELSYDNTNIPTWGIVTLTCSVNPSSSTWKYFWYRGEKTSEPLTAQDFLFLYNGQISVSQGGIYWCRGGRRDRATDYSNSIVIYRAVATLQSSWYEVSNGETITIRCEIEDGGDTEWEYEWSTSSSDTLQKHTQSNVISATVHSGGTYYCQGKHKTGKYVGGWSNPITVTMSDRPKAQLSYDNRDILARGSVTLTCSVKTSSSTWKYFWYRGEKTSEPLTTQDVSRSHGQIRVSEGGVYWCRGGRGEPVYYTDYSDSIVIYKAVATLQFSWSEIYYEETIILKCEIENGGDTGWEYEWSTTSSNTPPKLTQSNVITTTVYSSGTYYCMGKEKGRPYSTGWSNPITVTLSDKPIPVVIVSPSWPTPGDSVTLRCEVEHHSEGWRFYWYKAVPELSYNYFSYSSQMLTGSSNGTEEDSYILHGQTHTAGYACRAGRGDPVCYTEYSKPKFVWSGDFHVSASLKVNPDRVQHFTSDSVSLNCEGNSTNWRVMRFTKDRYPSYCSIWGTMNGSTCNIHSNNQSDAVYWCESGSGEFSNAVNITLQDKDITLVSPVHPVTEGDSVFLGCKLKSGKQFVSNVFFYRNEILIQNDSRSDLSIAGVSKSDEGFYKCQHSRLDSPQSWMSVKAKSRTQSSSFPIHFTVRLIVGFLLLLIVLLLLYHYRRFKDPGFIRPVQSVSTNQDFAMGHMVNQNGAQSDEHSSPLCGEAEASYENLDAAESSQTIAAQERNWNPRKGRK